MDYNLHPPLSSVPITLLVVTILLEIIHIVRPSSGARSAARFTLLFSACSAVLAFFSGYPASDAANQTFLVPDEAISRHHTIGRLFLIAIWPCVAVSWISDRARHAQAMFRGAYFILLFLSASLAIFAGYLGGELVFVHGAGVSASAPVNSSR